ncbi:MAG: hypothetical protein AB7H93_15065 [Vicinamibacterales bacterium]
MIRSAQALGIVALWLLGAVACRGESPKMPGLPGTTVGPETTRLLAALADAGFTFNAAAYQPVPATYLHAPVTALQHGDESLAVWEYPTPDAASDDRQRVSTSGIDGCCLELGSEARWFLHGRLLVLYLGVDPALRAALRRSLGQTVVGPAA